MEEVGGDDVNGRAGQIESEDGEPCEGRGEAALGLGGRESVRVLRVVFDFAERAVVGFLARALFAAAVRRGRMQPRSGGLTPSLHGASYVCAIVFAGNAERRHGEDYDTDAGAVPRVMSRGSEAVQSSAGNKGSGLLNQVSEVPGAEEEYRNAGGRPEEESNRERCGEGKLPIGVGARGHGKDHAAQEANASGQGQLEECEDEAFFPFDAGHKEGMDGGVINHRDAREKREGLGEIEKHGSRPAKAGASLSKLQLRPTSSV